VKSLPNGPSPISAIWSSATATILRLFSGASAKNLVKWGKPLVAAVKKLDTTRPVTSALACAPMSNAVGFADLLDVAGYNYQEKYYTQDHQQYPKRILLGSENHMSLEAWKAVTDNDYVCGQFLWTGFDFLGEARAWPIKASQSGLFDLCGYKKPVGFLRQALWSDKPMVYLCAAPLRPQQQDNSSRGPRNLLSSWNWPEKSNVNVLCYTNCQKVELFLNDKSLGAKSPADSPDRRLSWQTPYAPGTLKAVGINEDKTVCEYVLQTAGPAKKIVLNLDPASCYPGTKDTFQFEVSVTDETGVLVPIADNEITLTIDGPARVIGFGSGNPASHDNETDATHRVYHGRALAVIQSDGQPGKISIKATSPDLNDATMSIEKY
jgi:beta-galactosidase